MALASSSMPAVSFSTATLNGQTHADPVQSECVRDHSVKVKSTLPTPAYDRKLRKARPHHRGTMLWTITGRKESPPVSITKSEIDRRQLQLEARDSSATLVVKVRARSRSGVEEHAKSSVQARAKPGPAELYCTVCEQTSLRDTSNQPVVAQGHRDVDDRALLDLSTTAARWDIVSALLFQFCLYLCCYTSCSDMLSSIPVLLSKTWSGPSRCEAKGIVERPAFLWRRTCANAFRTPMLRALLRRPALWPSTAHPFGLGTLQVAGRDPRLVICL